MMLSQEEDQILHEAFQPAQVDSVRQFIANCLHQQIERCTNHSSQHCLHYDKLLQQLHTRDDQEMISLIYISLTSLTSIFTHQSEYFQDLMSAIFSFDWNCDNSKVTIAYRKLIGSIISSNTTMIGAAYQTLVKSFLKPSSVSSTIAGMNSIAIDFNEFKHYNVHRTLKTLLSLVPTSQSQLFNIIETHFPHRRFDISIQVSFTNHLLHICEYIPTRLYHLFNLIISKCLEIDVEIVIEDSGNVMLAKNLAESHSQEDNLFEFEDTPVVQNNAATNYAIDTTQRIPAEVCETAEKLDAMLLLIVQFIDNQMSSDVNATLLHSSSYSSSQIGVSSAATSIDSSFGSNSTVTAQGSTQHQDKLFHILLYIFEDRILSTHHSKFVQFLLFYFASKVKRYSEIFPCRLLEIFVTEKYATMKRQSAVLYLASYLSRATFVSLKMCNDILSDIVTWCGTYVANFDPSPHPVAFSSKQPIVPTTRSGSTSLSTTMLSAKSFKFPNFANTEVELDEYGRYVPVSNANSFSRHETFYCALQAACYLMCFYGVDIAKMQLQSSLLRVDWEHILTSRLEPMRYCLHSIRLEFFRLISHVGLLREEIWNHPNFSTELLQSQTISTNKKTTSNPLDSFFPFDPCLLLGLHHRVEDSYRQWTGLPGMEDTNMIDDLADEDEDVDMDTDVDMDNESSYLSASISSSIPNYFNQTNPNTTTNDTLLAPSNPNTIEPTLPQYGGDVFLKSLRKMSNASSGFGSMASSFGGGSPDWKMPTGDYLHYDVSNEEINQSNLKYFEDRRRNLASQSVDGTLSSLVSNIKHGVIPQSEAATDGWPIPARRPRQYSVGSTGSW